MAVKRTQLPEWLDLRIGERVAGRWEGKDYRGRLVAIESIGPGRFACVVTVDSPVKVSLLDVANIITVIVPGGNEIRADRVTLAAQVAAGCRMWLGRISLATRVIAAVLAPLAVAAAAGYPMFIYEEALQSAGLAASTAMKSEDQGVAAAAVTAYESTLIRAQRYADSWLGAVAFWQRDSYREYFFRTAPVQLDALRSRARFEGFDPTLFDPKGSHVDGFPVLRRAPLDLTKKALAVNDITVSDTTRPPAWPGSEGMRPVPVARRGGWYVWYDGWHGFGSAEGGLAAARNWIDQLERELKWRK
ncbi:MAG: hypothetical protein KIPDCIKN_04343 [Haliscomenobacter sp.]|nr:hypothetical protein [Haliscomenobacter sp.]